jgi:hypothetical protein
MLCSALSLLGTTPPLSTRTKNGLCWPQPCILYLCSLHCSCQPMLLSHHALSFQHLFSCSVGSLWSCLFATNKLVLASTVGCSTSSPALDNYLTVPYTERSFSSPDFFFTKTSKWLGTLLGNVEVACVKLACSDSEGSGPVMIWPSVTLQLYLVTFPPDPPPLQDQTHIVL